MWPVDIEDESTMKARTWNSEMLETHLCMTRSRYPSTFQILDTFYPEVLGTDLGPSMACDGPVRVLWIIKVVHEILLQLFVHSRKSFFPRNSSQFLVYTRMPT